MVEITGGKSEDGVVIGNTYDKYGSSNPVVQRIMRGFDDALGDLVERAAPDTVHEVGCGEGFWVLEMLRKGIDARGSDFSTQVIETARRNAEAAGRAAERFKVRSVYDVEPEEDAADLVVCCEVLEHVEEPERALQAISALDAKHVVISVPREPIWRTLNLARGHYVSDLGNTPGHIQHWSARGITALVSRYFDVVETRRPLPWTMLLCKPRP